VKPFSEIVLVPVNINERSGEPVIWVSYVNNVGLENYWTYENLPMGRSGTAYINHYNGGLTYAHNDVALAGERMPLTLAHTYVSDHENADGEHWGMRFGVGFRLNVLEEITYTAKTDDFSAYYTLVDGDSTVHAFSHEKGNTYAYSELNKDIKLEDFGSYLELTDDVGNLKIYTQRGSTKHYYLTKIKDANGNEQNITYDTSAGRITKITDAVGRVITLSYDNDGYLNKITDPNNKSITYEYDKSNKELLKITYPDVKETKFTYMQKPDRNAKAADRTHLASVQEPDGLFYTFDYQILHMINRTSYRVRSATVGEGSYETVVIKGDSAPSTDGLWVKFMNFIYKVIWYLLLFPSWLKIDKYGVIYIDGKEPDRKYGDTTEQRFHISTIRSLSFQYDLSETKIIDSSNYTPITYTFDRMGRTLTAVDSSERGAFTAYNDGNNKTNLPQFSAGATPVRNLLKNPSNEYETSDWTGNAVTANDAFAGQKSWQLTNDGTTVQQKQTITGLQANVTYTLSAFVKGNAKARLEYDVNKGIDLDCSDEWQRFTTTFTATSSSAVISIVLNAPGTIYFDAAQLEKNGGASPYNYVENSNFSSGATNWTAIPVESTAGDGIKSGHFELVGKPDIEKAVVQDIPLNAKAGDMIVFGATAEAYAIDDGFKVFAEFTQADGGKETADISFNKDVKNRKQTVAKSYALKEACVAMRLFVCYYKQANSMNVYDSFVFIGSGGLNMEYDGSGHLTKATTSSGTINYTYNNADLQKIQIQKPNGDSQTAEYTYDNKHNIVKAIEKSKHNDQEIVIAETSYVYGTGGTLTSVTTEADGASTTQTIQYTNDNNDVSKIIDGSGLFAEYQYASRNRNVLVKSNGSDGSEYRYDYDNQDFLTSIQSEAASNNYTYENDQMKSISHNGTIYNFDYNILGQTTKTSIGDQVIATNSYDSKTNGLQAIRYSNGQEYSTTHDNFGRISSEKYTYDYTGLRAEKTVNGITTKYLWAGDLLMSQTDGTNTISWSYDASGTMLGFELNGTPYFYLRNLQNDVVGIYDANGAVVARYEYDAWGNIVSATNSFVANHNPIRYRGYYWDSEINLYYLQSRYYNSAWGRFINADVYLDTGDGVLGTNMYAYCYGDPVNLVDPSGHAPIPGFPPQLPPYGNFQPQPAWVTNAQANAAANWHPPMANPPSATKPATSAQATPKKSAEDSTKKAVVIQAAEHQKKGTTNPANKAKHERGQSRKQKDSGGEKGDARRKPNPNKRLPKTFNTEAGVDTAAAAIFLVFVVANDLLPGGAIDDDRIPVLLEQLFQTAPKVFGH
jgi:RHS repeat-associated protein